MSEAPVKHIGFAFGIMILSSLIMNSWLYTQKSLTPASKNLWEDSFKLIHENTELEFHTTATADFWGQPGLNWNMTLKAKLPCTKGEEMIEEMSKEDEEKTFKLLDQLHSAILLKERKRIIGSEHALGHFLKLKNSEIFSSEEIDFKKLYSGMSWSTDIYGPIFQISNDSIKFIPRGKVIILKLKISQGRLKYQELDLADSFQLFRRVDNTTSLPNETEGSTEPEFEDREICRRNLSKIGCTCPEEIEKFDDPEYKVGQELFWLYQSKSTQIINSSEIDFLKSQLETGVFLSLKVVGSEEESSDKGIGYTLNTLSGSQENCMLKFSSNIHINSKSSPEVEKIGNLNVQEILDSQDGTKGKKPMVIRIPRRHAETGKIDYFWYNFVRFFHSLFSSPSPPIDNFCLTYERGVKGDVDILLPKAIVSFLICY